MSNYYLLHYMPDLFISLLLPLASSKDLSVGPQSCQTQPSLHFVTHQCTTHTVFVPLGVPTVWLNLLKHVAQHKLTLKYLKRVCIAGSAPPRSMIEALEK